MKIRNRTREAAGGYLFALPWLVGLSIFVFYPFIANIFYSFTEYNIIESPVWVGIDNYRVLMDDSLFWKSLFNTIYYSAVVPLQLIIALLLALLLNQKVKGQRYFRTFFYLPVLVPLVASSVLWKWMLSPNYGLVNSLLYKIGVNGPGWFASESWSKPALILMGTWTVGGAMIIFLATLQDIPQVLYEAAEIDGATTFKKTFHITLPLLTPAIFFNLIMGIIGSFQVFTQAYIITGGGPMYSTTFYVLYLYNNAFKFFRMGRASAMALILFIVIFIITLFIVKTSSKWVYYEAGGRK